LLGCGEGTGASDDCGGTSDDCGGTSDDCGGTSVEVDAPGEGAIVGVDETSVVVGTGLGSLLDAETPFAGGTPLGGESFTNVDEGLFASETGVSVQGRLSQRFRTPQCKSCQKKHCSPLDTGWSPGLTSRPAG